MKQIINYFIILTIIFFTSCEEKIEHPEIKTLTATPISGFEVKLSGEIVKTGEFTVSDYGFTISPSSFYYNFDDFNNYKISMGNNIKEGIFDTIVVADYLHFTAYLTNTKGTAFGETVNFTMPEIDIYGMTPSYGTTIGDTITINGVNFGINSSILKIRIDGNSMAKITEINNNQIKFVLPFDPSYESVYITYGKNYSRTIYCGYLY